jgi:transposase-like protein
MENVEDDEEEAQRHWGPEDVYIRTAGQGKYMWALIL